MPGFGDIFQKAVYLGVGLASYAGEKAGSVLNELRTETQKLADEMVKRGEMTTEEARRFVEDTIRQAQEVAGESPGGSEPPPPEPRRIEILDVEEEETDTVAEDSVNQLRQQVRDLQEELRRLQRD
jgi:polyhydroxyalkanoate synthesis regulator phasin